MHPKGAFVQCISFARIPLCENCYIHNYSRGDSFKAGDRTPNNHTLVSIDRTSSDRFKAGDRILDIGEFK